MTTPTDSAGRLRDVLRTACGRELTVSTLLPDPVGGHGGRIVLGTSLRPEEWERCWSGLTADEARRLAGYLLAHAAVAVAAESQGPGPAGAAASAAGLDRSAGPAGSSGAAA